MNDLHTTTFTRHSRTPSFVSPWQHLPPRPQLVQPTPVGLHGRLPTWTIVQGCSSLSVRQTPLDFRAPAPKRKDCKARAPEEDLISNNFAGGSKTTGRDMYLCPKVVVVPELYVRYYCAHVRAPIDVHALCGLGSFSSGTTVLRIIYTCRAL